MNQQLVHDLLMSSRALAITGRQATVYVVASALPLALVIIAMMHFWRRQ